MTNRPRLHGSLLIAALTLACGMQAAVITPTASPSPTSTVTATPPAESVWTLCVLADTLTLRHEPSEQSAAYDGLELHKGDIIHPQAAAWTPSGNIWYKLSPVEWVGGYIDGEILVGAC